MAPNQIALITDSTCDIPLAWREQFDIAIVPLTIVWGEEQYLDGVDLKAEDFYARLQKDSRHPSTSQPSPALFLKAYQDAAQKGSREILVFTISSAMSGTIESARQAAVNSPIPVHIVDGKSNSMGLGWQVIAAARARETGCERDQMIGAAAEARKNMNYYISLNTIEYLSRGGRIGSATKFLGNLLNIKPLISVNHQTGSVVPSIPARSRARALDGMYKEFFKHMDTRRPMHITVLHNAALEEAEQIAERVRAEYNPQEMFISIVSPVLGVHTGPQVLALCGYYE